jgi:hypothetical protein
MAARNAPVGTAARVLGGWLASYLEAHRDAVAGDEEFARWLEEEYVPLAGGWHY